MTRASGTKRARSPLAALAVLVMGCGGAHATPLGLEEAIRATVASNAGILLQKQQVEASRGALQQASGQFDATLSASSNMSVNRTPLSGLDQASYAAKGFPLSTLRTDTSVFSLALSKQLRNGMVLAPSVSATRTDGTTYDLTGQPAQNRGVVGFSLQAPLLKGSGASASAGESASRLEWEASRQDLRHAVSLNVLNTVAAYWNLVGASKNLDIARESESGVQALADETDTLIAADELPAAERTLIQANLIDKRAARIAAEQALFDARQTLGRAMGLPYAKIAALEPPTDFPAFAVHAPSPETVTPSLVENATSNRADLAAARLRRDAARILSSAAQDDLKPQLDLNLGVGYAGLAEGGRAGDTLDAFGRNPTGANLSAGIVYRWPFDNNVARGRFLQQSAVYDQSDIRVGDLTQSIATDVASTVSGLARSALQLEASERSVTLYRTTVENEKTKHTLGSSTLIDVLSVNDRLLNARLANVAYRVNYLSALARLAFSTGQLVIEGESGENIRVEQFISAPRFDQGTPPDGRK